MPKYHINKKGEVAVCTATKKCSLTPAQHFEEDKILTMKTSIDALFKPKKQAETWVTGYKSMLENYLTEYGVINNGYEVSYGMLFLKPDKEKDNHFKTCEKGNRITKIEEQTFTIPGFDSFRTPDEVPVALVEGQASCGCGKIKDQKITVQEGISDILLTALKNTD